MTFEIAEQNRVQAERILRALRLLHNEDPKHPVRKVFEDLQPEALYCSHHEAFPFLVREIWKQILLYIYGYDRRNDNRLKVANLERFARRMLPEINVVEELRLHPELTWDEAAVIASLTRSA